MLCLNQAAKGRVFIFVFLPEQDFIMEVFPVRIGGEKSELKIEGFAEILANIADYFLLCSGSKTGYRDWIFLAFFLLNSASQSDKILTNIERGMIL